LAGVVGILERDQRIGYQAHVQNSGGQAVTIRVGRLGDGVVSLSVERDLAPADGAAHTGEVTDRDRHTGEGLCAGLQHDLKRFRFVVRCLQAYATSVPDRRGEARRISEAHFSGGTCDPHPPPLRDLWRGRAMFAPVGGNDHYIGHVHQAIIVEIVAGVIERSVPAGCHEHQVGHIHTAAAVQILRQRTGDAGILRRAGLSCRCEYTSQRQCDQQGCACGKGVPWAFPSRLKTFSEF